MEEMANRQTAMEKQLATGPASALGLPLGIRAKPAAAPPLAALGPPPKTGRVVGPPPTETAGLAEAEATEALEEYGGPAQQQDPLAQAVLEQSRALTSLVAQLSTSSGDGLVELGAEAPVSVRRCRTSSPQDGAPFTRPCCRTWPGA